MLGTVIDDRYQVIKTLGQGGMGTVYLVENIRNQRQEALKILRLGGAIDHNEAASRFRREARAVHRLRHPSIIALYNFGRLPDGRIYLAMEYADGEDLWTLMQAGPVHLERGVPLLAQLADAIDHAHARGVVHRDLKPDNMILVSEPDGLERLKVLDFGVAKIVDPQYADSILSANDGWVLGTPAYMAPEQLTGVGDDTRIDIYSFGCVAFRMLTGTMPFSGRTMDICHAHIHTPPPSLRARAPTADIPVELEDLVLRCMEKDPRLRFQTGGDIVRALEAVPLPSAAWAEWERAKTLPG